MRERVLVTGAGKGFGAYLALALAKSGYSLVLHYKRSKTEVENVLKTCQKLGVEADILYGDFSSLEGLKSFTENYLKRFTTKALINNVGNYLIKKGSETSLEDWLDLFQTNLHTPFFLIKELLPSLKKTQGCVINIGSPGLHHLNAKTYSTAYSLTKSTLWHLTLSFAKELTSEKVTVNMVSPGYFETSIDLPEKLPMGRPTSFEEVSRTILFLLSEENHMITGQNIEVAGGVSL